MRKFLLSLSAAGICAIASMPAHAVTFTNVGDSYSANYNGVVASAVVPGLTASVTYSLASIAGNSLFFNFTVNNTSGGAVTNSRVSTFGFDSSAAITGSAITGGTLFTNTSSGNVPNLGSRDFCVTGGPNCAGGAGTGVWDGTSDSGQFRLDFASAPGSVDFSGFFVRYQSIDAPNLRLDGASGEGVVTNGGVPEPATWAMMILGFAVVGGMMRRRGTSVSVAYA